MGNFDPQSTSTHCACFWHLQAQIVILNISDNNKERNLFVKGTVWETVDFLSLIPRPILTFWVGVRPDLPTQNVIIWRTGNETSYTLNHSKVKSLLFNQKQLLFLKKRVILPCLKHTFHNYPNLTEHCKARQRNTFSCLSNVPTFSNSGLVEVIP